MPIFEYKCPRCGKETELIKKHSDTVLCKCNMKMNKKVSTSDFHLKGTGWYKTDYSNKKA